MIVLVQKKKPLSIENDVISKQSEAMKETKRAGSFLLGKSEHECMGFGRDEVCKWNSIIPS